MDAFKDRDSFIFTGGIFNKIPRGEGRSCVDQNSTAVAECRHFPRMMEGGKRTNTQMIKMATKTGTGMAFGRYLLGVLSV